MNENMSQATYVVNRHDMSHGLSQLKPIEFNLTEKYLLLKYRKLRMWYQNERRGENIRNILTNELIFDCLRRKNDFILLM